MAIREKIKLGVQRFKTHFESGPTSEGPSRTSSTQNLGPSNNPSPASSPLVTSSDANHLPAPHVASMDNAPSIFSQPVTASPTPPAARSLVGRSNKEQPDPSLVVTAPAPSIPSSTERDTKHTAWSGLKTFLGVLDTSADTFGPLKSAVGGITSFIEIFERASKGREDYTKLKTELDSLFEDLSRFISGSAPPTMTLSIENLAKGIEREIQFIVQKEERNTTTRFAEAMEDADEVLECYRRVQALLTRLALNANVNTWKIVDEQATDIRLSKLPSSPAARYCSAEANSLRRDRCTPNTRIEVLERLAGWAYNDSSQKIYWLNGMAGTGKTTIACSFCHQLERGLILAASFFCSRQLPECRNVNRIIPTISYQLALFSRPFRYILARALERDPQVHNQALPDQFEKLIVEPLQHITDTIPTDLVVVIDALDECDDKDGVGRILDILLLHAPSLPVKFFVTSRPEPNILDCMRAGGDKRLPLELRLHELEHSTVQEDIRTYLTSQLHRLNLPATDLDSLVERSGVLFIYAATVVRYIGADNFARSTRRLKQVLDASSSPLYDSHKEINTLYSAMLEAAFDDSVLEGSDKIEMSQVLRTVICAQEPLTTDVIASLLQLDDETSVRLALRPLQSVLHVSEPSGHVTTLHESFPEYMLDANRSGRFHCNGLQHNGRLTERCFGLIRIPDPPFNICDLESSFVFDKDVSDLGKRIDKTISRELFYACRYWGSHLILAETSQAIWDGLLDFLTMRLLLWMEILNLKQCIHSGASLLHRVQEWSQNHSCSTNLKQLTEDAWRFVISFTSSPFARSTPHIYVSALPFWPEQRPISKHYTKKMKGLIQASGAAMKGRDSAALGVCTTDSQSYSVAYSPGGARIISGYGDGTIRIWDAHTTQIIGEPFTGHTSAVRSVAYSPNDRHVVSGSDDNTIRIWDTHTGQMIGGPLTGHTNAVRSVAYSPDSRHIVSGSSDSTLRIWDARTGQIIGGPIKSHTDPVTSVVYSPDGGHIISCSHDNTIRIWDAQTGQITGKLLGGHTGQIYSVAYAPDGGRIVSGSADKTIRIWEAQTGQTIGQPLEGHVGCVRSVAFSPDGGHIISGSDDTTVRIWDAQTGQMIGEPLKGHTDWIWSVACSSDGAHIVSGSHDATLRIWDANISQTVAEPLVGHTDIIWSVACSPDCSRIVSGSADRSICIWDVHTSQMIGEPLRGHTNKISSVTFSPDSAQIACGSDDNTICIWDANTSQLIGKPLEGHTKRVWSVVYSPDGAIIASGSADMTIHLWDAHTGQMIGEPLDGHTDDVNSVAFSPNSARIASGSEDTTMRVWDARTGQIIGVPLAGHTEAVRSVAYSPNGAHIVSGSGDATVRIWDAYSGQIIGEPLEGHSEVVWSVAYSPNGAYIVSGSEDNTICIWNAHTGQMIGAPLIGHTGAVNSVAYSPDGARIFSGSDDMSIRTWDADAGRMVDPSLEGQMGHSISTRPVVSNNESLTANLGRLGYENNGLHGTWVWNADGWVVGGSRLLIWVPPNIGFILHPLNTAIISTQSWIRLDFRNAAIGDSWRRCYNPA